MTNKCIVKGCHRQAATVNMYRGMCLVCYSRAKKAVDEKKLTWARLEELGLALPADHDPLGDALREAGIDDATDKN